ncbi:MAG: phytanoyl-CoA dioxygenase family protein [Ilumatobacteraceae bacterium]
MHTGPAAWPPEIPFRFSADELLPEIHADDLEVGAVRAGVLGHGALIVRSLLDPDRVGRLAECIPAAFAAYRDVVGGTPEDDTDGWVGFLPTAIDEIEGRRFVWEGGGILAADSPRSLFAVMEVLDEIGFVDLVTGYFGERPSISAKKTTLRDVPPDTASGWHQDGAFMGVNIRSLNLWIALTPCGVDAASLDLVPRRLDDIMPTGTEGAPFDWAASDAVATEAAGDRPIVRPVFAAGDAILFDHMNLHRTAADPGLTQHRLALECWFFAPSAYPVNEIPLAL